MMLADMGADVIRIDRIGSPATPQDFTLRGRKSVAMDLKQPEAVNVALELLDTADGLIEGFRPGVMERLGLGPDICHRRNPALVYGRMTGWGQAGPLSHAAGHDLNYIALTGALWATGEADRAPTFPMNLLGDFGGGGMYLAFGLLAGILQAQATGQGDVVDAAICDGTNSLMTFIHAQRAMGHWQDARGANFLDGGVPWYAVYACADGQWVSIGALEPKFWDCLLDKLGLDPDAMGDREDPQSWDHMRKILRETFLSQPRRHWEDLLGGTDACFAPVLTPAEARQDPHMQARAVFLPGAHDQPAPAPRFENGTANAPAAPRVPGADTRAVLLQAGLRQHRIDELIALGAVAESDAKDDP